MSFSLSALQAEAIRHTDQKREEIDTIFLFFLFTLRTGKDYYWLFRCCGRSSSKVTGRQTSCRSCSYEAQSHRRMPWGYVPSSKEASFFGISSNPCALASADKHYSCGCPRPLPIGRSYPRIFSTKWICLRADPFDHCFRL